MPENDIHYDGLPDYLGLECMDCHHLAPLPEFSLERGLVESIKYKPVGIYHVKTMCPGCGVLGSLDVEKV